VGAFFLIPNFTQQWAPVVMSVDVGLLSNGDVFFQNITTAGGGPVRSTAGLGFTKS